MRMTEHVKVKIDLDRVANNLRTADGTRAGDETARSFLRQAGFSLDRDGTWIGPRAGLQRLNYSEVLGVEPAWL
jgi:hypothetical protein